MLTAAAKGAIFPMPEGPGATSDVEILGSSNVQLTTDASLPVRLVLNAGIETRLLGHTVWLATGFTLGMGLTVTGKVTGAEPQPLPRTAETVTMACLFTVVLFCVVIIVNAEVSIPLGRRFWLTDGSLMLHA